MVINTELESKLVYLKSTNGIHQRVAGKCQGYWPVDVLVLMILKRSLSLISGYDSLIRIGNFTCAAPIIRMQIDNLLRFHAAFMVDDIENYMKSILSGTPTSEIKDRNNQKMRDSYLVKCLKEKYDWIEHTYDKASSFVHLSEAHFKSIIKLKIDDPRNSDEITMMEFWIGPEDKFIDEEIFNQATDSMILVIQHLLYALVNKVEIIHGNIFSPEELANTTP